MCPLFYGEGFHQDIYLKTWRGLLAHPCPSKVSTGAGGNGNQMSVTEMSGLLLTMVFGVRVMWNLLFVVDHLSYPEFFTSSHINKTSSLKELKLFANRFMIHVYIGCKSFSGITKIPCFAFSKLFVLAITLHIVLCVQDETRAFSSVNVPSTFSGLMLNTRFITVAKPTFLGRFSRQL